MWEWSDDPTPWCPFCGNLGSYGPNAPEEAKQAIEKESEITPEE